VPFSLSLFLLQWSVGSLFFLWITTRHRVVGIGYGWISRVFFGFIAALAFWFSGNTDPIFKATAIVVVLCTIATMISSYLRREAGVSGQNELAEARSERVAAMTGIELEQKSKSESVAEFDPNLDLLAPIIGFIGLLIIGVRDASLLDLTRVLVGTLFMGAVSDAMLLGHWYLVQPGLKRAPLKELTYWTTGLWLPISVLYLIPTGMVSVFTGTIDDGYAGLLGWFWIACVVTTLGLLVMTIVALRERQYSAVMAATGLLYLAILTAFGIDLVARALLF